MCPCGKKNKAHPPITMTYQTGWAKQKQNLENGNGDKPPKTRGGVQVGAIMVGGAKLKKSRKTKKTPIVEKQQKMSWIGKGHKSGVSRQEPTHNQKKVFEGRSHTQNSGKIQKPYK